MKELWNLKYRPGTLDEYVWKDETFKSKFQQMINDKVLPHLLFTGTSGIGKTTLARLLLKELNVDSGDILEINGSLENNADTVRNKILNFTQTWAIGDMKYILIDEYDYFTINAQAMLRNLTETYANNARFILTCNYEHKVIPAIKGRCMHFHFKELDMTEFTVRAATVLTSENIQFDIDDLDLYIKASYPDLRKCINLLQEHSINNVLISPDINQSTNTQDYMLVAIELFKNNKINEGRKILVQNARPEEYTDLYTFFYKNLDLWSDNEDKQNEAIIIIAKYLDMHSRVADPEICLSACLVALNNINKQEE